MDKLCNLLGKSLFKKVQEKLNGETLYLNDGKLIPKYRLDEVSKQVKDLKLKNANLRAVLETREIEYIQALDKLKINLILFKLVAKSRPKDFDVVLKFIKKENLTLCNVEASTKYQIRKIKSHSPHLFFCK